MGSVGRGIEHATTTSLSLESIIAQKKLMEKLPTIYYNSWSNNEETWSTFFPSASLAKLRVGVERGRWVKWPLVSTTTSGESWVTTTFSEGLTLPDQT